MKNRIINVQDVPILISQQELDDYICITDIAKAKTGESRSADVVKNWLRNRNTLEFLIGLYLCKRLCEKLGIGIAAESSEQGTAISLAFHINCLIHEVQG